MKIVDGWLVGADICESPNQNDRPVNVSPDLLVVHNISLPPGQFGGGNVEAFFRNELNAGDHPYFAEICHLKVSAHMLIERSGRMVQFVSFDKRAWHAGISAYQGREACNDFSVGIELEGCDDVPYTLMQYQMLSEVHKALQVYYPNLSAQAITGHSDIAPGRKTDPGPAFNWQYFKGL
ncbi:1,6-anhydro-N-acetylmuramyl-L-alanine amidase AmpD [Aliamphritea spongicola]|uniref:1,6-anhydro-N-acetylmuramyl-L-alanine amidase AmpD n=1 Tax=Aliamphritea spongicola TaxID=707589 RepID=UPI00196AF2B7|nr:1,6-anhydro-N-acetylmuramyl-L-alanine amidase AmpD [Aliamphritea spongicola]MBN3563392.1 1,6-anhydro-N-acetylmuramyl-L-alanine amidase AmpD [Aliamphritea spongicola]